MVECDFCEMAFKYNERPVSNNGKLLHLECLDSLKIESLLEEFARRRL